MKLHVGEPNDDSKQTNCRCIINGGKKESPLSDNPKNIYLPPKEQLDRITKAELDAWKIGYQQTEEQRELVISLENEASRSKEKAMRMGVQLLSTTDSTTFDHYDVCGLVRSNDDDKLEEHMAMTDVDMSVVLPEPELLPTSSDEKVDYKDFIIKVGGNEET